MFFFKGFSCVHKLVIIGLLVLCGTLTRLAIAAPLDELASTWAEQHDVTGAWRLQRGDIVLAEGGRGAIDTFAPPITADTPLWIGSNSKQFAAAAVLRLVEQGRVELGAPLTRYFPELKPAAVTRAGSTCSVEHVLSHGCGLVPDAPPQAAVTNHLWDPEQEATLLALVNAEKLSFDPGSGYTYSNLGYALIGLLVQRASGQGYEQFLQEQFWGPLGMTHTGIRPRQGLHLARGQAGAVLGWVDAARWLFFAPLDLQSTGAAGNIYSSARDLATWVHALHHGKVLSAASWAEMTRVRSADYALGLVVSNAPGGKRFYHNGELAPYRYSSQSAHLPEQDLTVVVLSNRALPVGRSLPFMDYLLAQVTQEPLGSASPLPLWQLRLKDSGEMLFIWLPLVLVLLLLIRRVRRPELLDRQNWWLSFHIYAVLLGAILTVRKPVWSDPWLIAWGLVLLASVYQSRFWQLPKWQRGSGLRPYVGLVLRSLGLLFLLGFFAHPYFLAAFALLLLAEIALWLTVTHRSRAQSASPATAS